jgi:hypothetical protein
MALTYEPISTTTLGTATATISFSSIPQTYTDLRVVFSGKADNISSLYVRLNNDTSTANYLGYNMYSQSTTPTASFDANLGYIVSGAMALSINSSVIDIFKYTTTTYYRPLLIRSSNAYAYLNERRASAFWLSTSAVTTVTLGTTVGSLAVGTMATLYGIKAA